MFLACGWAVPKYLTCWRPAELTNCLKSWLILHYGHGILDILTPAIITILLTSPWIVITRLPSRSRHMGSLEDHSL